MFRAVVGSVLIAGSVLVLSGAPASAAVTPTGVNISPTETESFTGTVATFTSSSGGPYTAMISWGDGPLTSAGTVTSTGPGAYSVAGTHTYAEDGSYTVTTTIDDASDASITPVSSTANVQEGAFVLSGVPPITVVEGQPFNGTVATFSDPGSSDPPSDYTASIDWGDGTTTAGDITSTGSSSFAVTGSHTYADELNGEINVTVGEPGVGFTLGPNPDSVTVTEGDFGDITPVTLTVPEGGTLTDVSVGSFTDAGNSLATASNWSASINWGDGTTAAGTVTGPTGGPFTVSGTHTYSSVDEGTLPVVVTVDDNPPSTLTFDIDSSVQITEGDVLTPDPGQPSLNVTAGNSLSGPVAVFDDTYTGAELTDFSAVINWGDGTTTAGTISGGTGGPFTVSGDHTYADSGNYTITTTLSDDAPGRRGRRGDQCRLRAHQHHHDVALVVGEPGGDRARRDLHRHGVPHRQRRHRRLLRQRRRHHRLWRPAPVGRGGHLCRVLGLPDQRGAPHHGRLLGRQRVRRVVLAGPRRGGDRRARRADRRHRHTRQRPGHVVVVGAGRRRGQPDHRVQRVRDR